MYRSPKATKATVARIKLLHWSKKQLHFIFVEAGHKTHSIERRNMKACGRERPEIPVGGVLFHFTRQFGRGSCQKHFMRRAALDVVPPCLIALEPMLLTAVK